MHPVYRAPMRSHRQDVSPGAAVERALELGVCGTGGRLSRPPVSLAQALALTEEEHGPRAARRLERFAAVPDGAFVWTRDVDGDLYLGRMAGPWRYDDAPEAGEHDLVHVRACDWLEAPTSPDEVPAAVHLTFRRGGRSFQQTHDAEVGPRSAALWERAHRDPTG